MSLQGKRVAVLVEEMYQDQEVWYPLYRLQEAGAKVTIVGSGKKEYKSKFGYPITEDLSVSQVKESDFDALIIPGGYAPDHMRRTPAFAQLVRAMVNANKPVGAICHGPWLLASADVLKGRHVTCFFAIKDDLVHAGARYTDEEVVQDKNLVTSRKPEDLPAFMRAFCAVLEKSK